jgi:hypothetical protein
MDPHKRTSRFPLFEYVPLSKPGGRAKVTRFVGNIVIYPWIWG